MNEWKIEQRLSNLCVYPATKLQIVMVAEVEEVTPIQVVVCRWAAVFTAVAIRAGPKKWQLKQLYALGRSI